MTEPLDYLARPKEPPARWSWCAVVGFSLSLTGPVLGYLLARIIKQLLPGHRELLLIAAITPLVTGFALSLIGAVKISSESSRIRGHGLAQAGVIAAALWGFLFAMIFFMFISNPLQRYP